MGFPGEHPAALLPFVLILLNRRLLLGDFCLWAAEMVRWAHLWWEGEKRAVTGRRKSDLCSGPIRGLRPGSGRELRNHVRRAWACVPGFLEPRGMGREGPGGRKGGRGASRMETHGAL